MSAPIRERRTVPREISAEDLAEIVEAEANAALLRNGAIFRAGRVRDWKPGRTFDDFEIGPGRYRVDERKLEAMLAQEIETCVATVTKMANDEASS